MCTSETSPPPEGWVELRSLARLWASVPPAERVTEEVVLRHWVGKSEYYRDIELEHLRNAKCEIANKSTEYRRRWFPCKHPVYEGQRCYRHGGARKPQERKLHADLVAENAALRERLAELTRQQLAKVSDDAEQPVTNPTDDGLDER